MVAFSGAQLSRDCRKEYQRNAFGRVLVHYHGPVFVVWDTDLAMCGESRLVREKSNSMTLPDHI